MQNDTLARLRYLSDRISHAESVCRWDLAHNRDLAYDPLRRLHYYTVLLRAPRLLLCACLIPDDAETPEEFFRDDWRQILSALRELWGGDPASGDFLSDAVELITLADPNRRPDLLGQLDWGTRVKIRRQAPLPDRISDTVFDMMPQISQVFAGEYCFPLLQNLISLSRQRNNRHPAQHRRILHHALLYLVDSNPELTFQVCRDNFSCFRNTADMDSAWLYWFYGVSAWNLKQTEEALPLLKHCQKLFLQLEGPRSWIGVRARILCLRHLLYNASSPETEGELLDIASKINDNYYLPTDQPAKAIATDILAAVLRSRVDQQTVSELLPEIEQLMAFCKATEEEPINQLLTVRHAENVLSAYYFETGQYLQAIRHTKLALDAVPGGNIPPFPSDPLLYSNLLKSYVALNDTDQMIRLIDHLTEHWDDFGDDPYESSEISSAINAAKSKLSLTIGYEDDPRDIEDSVRQLLGLYSDIKNGDLKPFDTPAQNQAFSLRVMTDIGNVLDHAGLSPAELEAICGILLFFLENPAIYQFSRPKKSSAYGLLAQCHQQMDSPMALMYIQKCLENVVSLIETHESRIVMQRFAAMLYFQAGHQDRALSLVRDTLAGITSAWQKAVAHLNDRKICQLLFLIQTNFKLCCVVARSAYTNEALYDLVLRFKDLPALVGRERNRILRLDPVDEALRHEIFSLQNQLAAAEVNETQQNSRQIQQLNEILQEKETLFAEKFPKNLQFTPISFPDVRNRIPRGSAVAEFFFSYGIGVLDRSGAEQDDLVLDVFLTVNRDGTSRLVHRTVPCAAEAADKALDFLDALLDPADFTLARRKESLRRWLHQTLIDPLLQDLEGISTLYIAPDDVLCNLPFEILYGPDRVMLQDRFRILRLVSGRDLLFPQDTDVPTGGMFILGDPDYDAHRDLGAVSPTRPPREDDFTRSVLTRSKPVSRLPFSGVEARRIADRCRCQAHTGVFATKYALQEALPRSLIHLATHGVFDFENESANTLYSSCLIFAGFNSWLESGQESPACGNGILTADEISRMDLSGTHLVVLSACQSGLGDIGYGSSQGLLSAFSAAGVRWIISHLWSASDLASTILMDAFYEAHLSGGLDVPDALSEAKNYLRTVTAGELRARGWLETFGETGDAAADNQLNLLRKARDQHRVFADEYYWGGFVCHRCK